MDIKSPAAEARHEYVYSGTGEKLQAVQRWNPDPAPAPVMGSPVSPGSLTVGRTTDYAGNKVYENGVLKRILVDGGYYEEGVYYFFLQDHLGSNRVLANASGAVEQKNHYYPFGATFAESTNRDKQPYQYNGKELEPMHGLELYDYGARFYDPVIGRWNVVDPLADKYYNLSPYNYVANNPIIAVDPDGKEIIFVVGDTRYTYRQGNLYLNGKSLHTPFTDGRYDFLSKDQQIVLDQYRFMENSGDEVFRGVLNTLVSSRNKHEIRQGDNSTTGVVAFGDWSQDAYEEYSSGHGSDSYSEFNFKTTRKQGYSDLETVFHEMRHMLDIDKGRLPSDVKYSEMNAVSAQNYVRKKEGKAARTTYKTRKSTYYYNSKDLQKSFDELLELIEKGMNESFNDFNIYFR